MAKSVSKKPIALISVSAVPTAWLGAFLALSAENWAESADIEKPHKNQKIKLANIPYSNAIGDSRQQAPDIVSIPAAMRALP